MRWIIGVLVTFLVAAATLFGASSPAAAQRAWETSPVVEIDDPSSVIGHSELLRSHRGVTAFLETRGLERGHTYTVWAVIFNNPDACEGLCDSSDLASPDVDGASVFATGRLARRDQATFWIRLRVGDALIEPMKAEIHFVVRSHGPAIPGLVGEQTSTLNGGCPPNVCANLLVAKHD